MDSLNLKEGRFTRLQSIDWWNQQRMQAARVLVVGAGALGNEVIKNLALLGIGQLAIVDMDVVEESNLSRSVLFRSADAGKPKAARAAAAARDLCPGIRANAIVANVLAGVGLGWFRWADITVGALDNREARVFVNRACARVGRRWIDGGIDVLTGVVRGFAPPDTACYECTMGKADWADLDRRRSCSLLARRALAERGTPTTPTIASIIGAIQAQEVVKFLHGLDHLCGRGFVFEGLHHSSYGVDYPIAPGCPWHEAPDTIETADDFTSNTRVSAIWRFAAERLGGMDAIDFSRELVERLECHACAASEPVNRPLELVPAEQVPCPACGAERVPHLLHTLGKDAKLLDVSIGELGLPRWDVVWCRSGARVLGIEISGDRPT